MVIADGKKIIFDTSFLVPNEKEVDINTTIRGELTGGPVSSDLAFKVVFKRGIPGMAQQGEWIKEGGIVKFIFTGWDNATGSCTQELVKFAELHGKKLFLQLVHYAISEFNF